MEGHLTSNNYINTVPVTEYYEPIFIPLSHLELWTLLSELFCQFAPNSAERKTSLTSRTKSHIVRVPASFMAGAEMIYRKL